MSKSLKLFGGVGLGITAMLVSAVTLAEHFITPLPPRPVSSVASELPRGDHDPAAVISASASPEALAASGLLVAAAQAATSGGSGKFGLGRPALPEEITAWDLDVSPDGTGLPEGSGDALTGEPLFEDNCASCHGSFAEGVDNWPKLAGGDGTLADEDPLKTVGSYWPHLSTVWDYVHRSMPFGNAQSLTPDEVYAIVAYILYSNDLIEEDFVLDRDSFVAFEMPNAGGFVVDDRPESEYSQWRAEPCMKACKPGVEITMRATVLDVTPEERAEDALGEEVVPIAESAGATEPAAAEESVADVAAPDETAGQTEAGPQMAAIDPELAAEGEKVFRKCRACHKVGEGATNSTGPMLNGVVGRAVGAVDGFKYSGAMADMGGVWDSETLHGFLSSPKSYLKGTRMSFAGLRKDRDIDAVVEYLKQFN